METTQHTRIIKECIHKVAQVIVQSRLKLKGAQTNPVNKWFNLNLPEIQDIRETVEGQMKKNDGLTTVLQIDVLLRSAVHATNILIERWHIQYEMDDVASVSTTVDPSIMYKNMIIMIRSLVSTTRFLPAYQLCKASEASFDAFKGDADSPGAFQLFYTISGRGLTNASPSFGGEKPASHVFTSLGTSLGKVHLSVFYRKNCDFEFTQTKPTHINQHIIQDYIPESVHSNSNKPTSSASPSPSLSENRRFSMPAIHGDDGNGGRRPRSGSDASYSNHNNNNDGGGGVVGQQRRSSVERRHSVASTTSSGAYDPLSERKQQQPQSHHQHYQCQPHSPYGGSSSKPGSLPRHDSSPILMPSSPVGPPSPWNTNNINNNLSTSPHLNLVTAGTSAPPAVQSNTPSSRVPVAARFPSQSNSSRGNTNTNSPSTVSPLRQPTLPVLGTSPSSSHQSPLGGGIGLASPPQTSQRPSSILDRLQSPLTFNPSSNSDSLHAFEELPPAENIQSSSNSPLERSLSFYQRRVEKKQEDGVFGSPSSGPVPIPKRTEGSESGIVYSMTPPAFATSYSGKSFLGNSTSLPSNLGGNLTSATLSPPFQPSSTPPVTSTSSNSQWNGSDHIGNPITLTTSPFKELSKPTHFSVGYSPPTHNPSIFTDNNNNNNTSGSGGVGGGGVSGTGSGSRHGKRESDFSPSLSGASPPIRPSTAPQFEDETDLDFAAPLGNDKEALLGVFIKQVQNAPPLRLFSSLSSRQMENKSTSQYPQHNNSSSSPFTSSPIAAAFLTPSEDTPLGVSGVNGVQSLREELRSLSLVHERLADDFPHLMTSE